MSASTDAAALLVGVHTALDEAAGHVDTLCDVVGAAVDGLPPGIAVDARARVADLRQAFAGVVTDLGGMLATAGDPGALRTAGTAWTDDIGAPVSRLVGVAADDVMETDDRWSGPAADAYRATLPAQQTALAAIVATGLEVDAVLGELAAAITDFWIAIGTACLGLVLALAGALGSAATVVGAPAAAGIALAGVGAVVAAGSSALSSLGGITTAAAARGAALDRRLADSSAFPLGAWPRSTHGISTQARDWQPR
ncbi:MAG: hypothetical protein QOK35_1858 [Pseudonocardiales bacterium]|nr:hypothetical protein [Pseudonocardiales bacterium]